MTKPTYSRKGIHCTFVLTTILIFSMVEARSYIHKSTKSLHSNNHEKHRTSRGDSNFSVAQHSIVTCQTLGKVLFTPRKFAPIFHKVEWRRKEMGKQCCEKQSKTSLYCSSHQNNIRMDPLRWHKFRKMCRRWRHRLGYSVWSAVGGKRQTVCVLFGKPRGKRTVVVTRKLEGPSRKPAAAVVQFHGNSKIYKMEQTKAFLNRFRSMYGNNFLISFPNSSESRASKIHRTSGGGPITVVINFNSTFFEEY